MKRILFLLCFLPIFCFGQYRADRARTNPNVADGNGYCFRGHLATETSAYCAEATALFAKITDWGTLTATEITTRKTDINTLITELKTAGVWQTRDRIWVGVMPSEQAASIEWKGTNDNLVKVNNPTFEADSGWASDGTSGYYSTAYLPSDGPNYALNDAGIETYGMTYSTVNDICQTGSYIFRSPENDYGIAAVYGWFPAYSAPVAFINTKTGANGVNTATKIGLFSANRIASDTVSLYVNGTLNAKCVNVSNYVPDQAVYLCAVHYWLGGTKDEPRQFDPRRLSFVMYGSSLTATQELALKNAFEKYMDAIGSGVMP